MRARDLMGSPAVTIPATATVGDAADLMVAAGVSCLPVLDQDGRLAGILSHSDFALHHVFKPMAQNLYTLLGVWATPRTLEQVAHEVRGRQVRDVMSQPVVTVKEDDPVTSVVETMLRHHVNRVPVKRGDTIVGVVSRHDLVKLVASPDEGATEDEAGRPGARGG